MRCGSAEQGGARRERRGGSAEQGDARREKEALGKIVDRLKLSCSCLLARVYALAPALSGETRDAREEEEARSKETRDASEEEEARSKETRDASEEEVLGRIEERLKLSSIASPYSRLRASTYS
jgi:hypothetical protein